MRKKFYTLLFILYYVIFLTRVSFGQPVSSTELIEKAKEYNNNIVEYQGEVVGDVMIRGEFAWVNLNDGNNAIGIWGKKDLINSLVRYKGGYNYKGDILLVTGVFHRACPEHGGDLDIHLTEVSKIKEGYPTLHPLNFTKVVRTVTLFIIVLGLFILSKLRKKKRDIL